MKVSMDSGKPSLIAPIKQALNQMVLDPEHLKQSLCRFIVVPTIAIGFGSSATMQMSVVAIDYVRPLTVAEQIQASTDPNASADVHGAVAFEAAPLDGAQSAEPTDGEGHQHKKRKKDKHKKSRKTSGSK
jgi:hypothetical protein